MDTEWTRRLDVERRLGNLTPAHELVLRAIALDLALGYPEPSEARLMSQAGVSRSTVQRAKARGRSLGLMSWERRYRTEAGRRVELPCRYRTETPTTPPKRERQVGARIVANVNRSVAEQLKSLPTPNGFHFDLWEKRKAAMNEAGRRGVLTYSAYRYAERRRNGDCPSAN